MKNKVFWYGEIVTVTDTDTCLEPGKAKHYCREIMVKNEGLSNQELLDIAKEDTFKISYFTKWQLSFLAGYGKLNAKYTGD